MSIRTLAFATAAAVGLALSVPAAATNFVLTLGATQPVPGSNDFQANLAALGLTQLTDLGASVGLTGNATLKFEFIAREAGFNNTFKTTTLSFTSIAPPTTVPWSADQLIGYQNYAAGPIGDWFFTPGGGPLGGLDQAIGTMAFGIFYDPRRVAGGTFSSRVLYLGLDDFGAGPDDNHDDLIIRVSIVPEPATWAMLITGFGLVGFAMRRRKTTAQVTA